MEPLIIAQVKEHLAQNDLESAVKLLNTYAESNLEGAKLNRLRNEIIHIQGQINEVKNAEHKGLIAFEQAERNRNQIRLSMLSITDALSGYGEMPESHATGRSEKAKAAQLSGTLKYVAIGVVALVVGYLIVNALSGSGSSDDNICHLIALENVDVLESAALDAEVIGTLPADAEYEVLDSQHLTEGDQEIEFFEINYNGGTGWVECCVGIELSDACHE